MIAITWYAYAGLGQLEQAIQEFETAIHLDPNLAKAHYNLGATYERTGKPEEARRQYQEALRLDPDFAAARGALKSLPY